jgi:hypothetical protein
VLPSTSVSSHAFGAANLNPAAASFVSGAAYNGHTFSFNHPPPGYVSFGASGARQVDVCSLDSWIDDLERNRSALAAPFRVQHGRLPKYQLPKLTKDPMQWPRFIRAFMVQVDRECTDDSERLEFLNCCVSDEIRDELGYLLLHPLSYQQCLVELRNRYGSPRVVAAACSKALLQMVAFKDHDFKALSSFSSTLRATVATLFLGGFQDELRSQATLQQVVNKLPLLHKDKWADYSFNITDRLPDLVDLDNWLH